MSEINAIGISVIIPIYNINYFSLLSKQYASNNNPNNSEHD